ncbi:hypothetical protein [Couchioplanes caeruleus]|uniref:hypothetical protein n=1 Tax=Couchioplanes caeruleus TaxID=56438 RepID=UPI000AD23602|nr:hypothetical protein [Couchioplanes caeruleus]
MIGSLSHLLRDAAIEAIYDGTERLTQTSLDQVTLDHAAERQTPPRPRRRQPAVRPA